MPYIIGTAGHIDHGKTSLVKALTGQDTDRLKEEKERGISIELGFAYLDLPDGTRAGVVDVPGHERFIRHMLAGAHGIDLVLFTVAADDGVMPQTEEHLDILHFLGVQLAIFVVTKVDLASEARIREVEEEVQILTSGTSLENSPIVPYSFLTGQGLDRLRAEIFQALGSYQKPEPHGYFRLPVDRVFVLQGHGLIVTGTAPSGEVRIGDHVRCLPSQQLFRVRSLQVHSQPVEIATYGQRVALNLSAPQKPSVERGHVICHEKITLTSDRFDAFLEVRPTATTGVKNHQRVRVHLGTAERLARLILLGPREKIEPRQSAYCQLSLSEPLMVLRGDHFIIRDETARRTLGGGTVIHPWAKKHKRTEPDLQEKLRSLHRGEPANLLETFLGESDDFALPIAPLYQFLNLKEDEVQELLEQMPSAAGASRGGSLNPPALRVFNLEGEKLYATDNRWRHAQQELLTALRQFHAGHPLAAGMDMEELRDMLPYQIAPRLFRAFVEQLEAQKMVVRDANLLRLPDHKIQLRDEEKGFVERIKALLGSNPLAPPELKQIEKEMGIGRARLSDVIRVMERERSIVRVATELYFLADCIDKVKRTLYEHLAEKSDITPASFRDLFGTSRKYTIPLLEYFDREGITIRLGDTRRLKSSSLAAKGGSQDPPLPKRTW
jgi:selenocysteine-specific elongation factor